MANKIWCLNCNKPSLYESNKPIVCGFCGKPYIDVSNANLTKPIPVTTGPLKRPVRQIEVEETYEEDNIPPAPQIDKIETELTQALRPNRENFKFNKKDTNQILSKSNKKSGKGKKITEEQIRTQWQQNFPKNKKHDIEGIE